MLALRPYQESAVQRTLTALRTHRTVLLVSPTGSGKTITAAALALQAVLDGDSVLWLCHRQELIDQAERALGAALGADQIGNSVRVASLQTLLARDERPPADLVILDEAHHAAAVTFNQIVTSYASARIVGLTATPQRGDGRGLGMFGTLVVATTPAELLADGHLVPIEIIRPARQLRPGQIAQGPLAAYQAHAAGRPTIVFASSVTHAETIAATFREAGLRAAAIDAGTAAGIREEAVTRFRAGDLDVLCNVSILTEGTDLPRASCAIVARGCGTTGLWLQMAGRIARPAPLKHDAILIDLRGVSHTHGHPYDPREYSLDGRGIRKVTEPEVDPGSFCRVCGAPIKPGDGCAECGIEAAAAKPIKVVNAPLVRYAAAMRQGPERRAENLRKWRAIGKVRGYKPRYAEGRFLAVYNEWPSAEIMRLAREER